MMNRDEHLSYARGGINLKRMNYVKKKKKTIFLKNRFFFQEINKMATRWKLSCD